MAIIVSGFSPSHKTPGFKATTNYASGRSSGNLFNQKVLITGQLGASPAATATANTVYKINSEADITKFGNRGELAQMLRGAFGTQGATIYALGYANAGATAATVTITVGFSTGTTAASTGTFLFRIAGVEISGTVTALDDDDAIAADIKAAFDANSDIPCVASVTNEVVTLTIDSAGARGNQYYLYQDKSGLPSNVTSVVAGGTAVTGGIVPFSGGLTNGSTATMLTNIFPERYNRIASAANDSTQLGLLEAKIDLKAGALEGREEFVVFATNSTLSAAQGLSATNVNNPYFQQLWCLYSETHPAVLAAIHATQRSVVESSNPSPRYGNYKVVGAAPQSQPADWCTDTTANDALNSGVTPLTTTPEGAVVVIRGITSYCRLNSNQDERCFDINQAVMPSYGRDRFKQIWDEDIGPNYTYVRDNPSTSEPEPPAGVLYPSLAKGFFTAEMKAWEKEGWVVGVDANPIVIEYNSSHRGLMSEAVIIPSPLNYKFGVNIRQRAE